MAREPGPRERPKRLPIVLTRGEVHAVLRQMHGTPQLVVAMLYGSGLRLQECLRLRFKDVDLHSREIRIRDGKGRKDRVTMIPSRLTKPLGEHLQRVKKRRMHELEVGFAPVPVPDAISRKYPNANRQIIWQWIFPALRDFVDEARIARCDYGVSAV